MGIYSESPSYYLFHISSLIYPAFLLFVVECSRFPGTTAHSPDYGFASSPPGIREAASTLVNALQGCPTQPPLPDATVVRTLTQWLQVSACFRPTLALSFANSISVVPLYDFITFCDGNYYFIMDNV